MDWIGHFQANGRRRIAFDWTVGIDVAQSIREPLIASLQKFQVGESGEGRHLRARAAATGDVVYAEAVRLFLAEEHVHASYLRRMLDLLDAPVITAHWSDALFVVGRRLMGLRLELLALLSAEMVAMYYYRMLRDGIDDRLVRGVCGQILRDENAHVAFHCDRLTADLQRRTRFVRSLTRVALRTIHTCAMFIVAFDHRDLIVALGIRPSQFVRECEAVFHRVDRRIFSITSGSRPLVSHPTMLRAHTGGRR